MSIHPEHERVRGESDDEDDSQAQSGVPIGEKLKAVARYLLQGFAPAVAVIALAVALIAVFDKRSGDSRMNEVMTELQNVNANLMAARSELESLRFIVTRQKSQLDSEKRQEERVDAIIRNVTKLQEKMKVSPTLAEQLRQSASAPAAAVPAGTAVEIVPDKAAKDAVQPVPAKATAKAPEQKTAPKAAAPAPGANKTPAQLQALKEAIEKFNRK